MATRIILDTDLAMGTPGSDIDDGFALALAVADPHLSLDLVTTVDGNTDVVTATRLSRELLQRLGQHDVPVIRGAVGPIHPRAGWRPPTEPVTPGAAAVAIVERVLAEPGLISVAAIGPLTNLALAVMLEPGFAAAVREIVVMGGSYLHSTNDASMPGEFNFWCDPDAASVVLASGARVSLVGLDVTRQVRLTRDDTAAMANTTAEFAPFAAACADEWISIEGREHPGEPEAGYSCALHDPLAVATIVHPDLVSWQPAFVQVEAASPTTRGIAVADLLQGADAPAPNCRIATSVDAAAFRRYFLEQLGSLP